MSISVSGGAGSFDAHLDDMLAVSSIIKASGSSLRELSDDAARASVNGSVLAAGLLCPVELAAAEAAILRATTGPDGLLPTGLEGSGLLVEAAVTSYRVVDGVGRELLDHAQQVVGMVAGGVAVVGAIGAASYLVTHPLDLVLLLSQKDSLLASVQTTLFEHPWLMDAATRLAPWVPPGRPDDWGRRVRRADGRRFGRRRTPTSPFSGPPEDTGRRPTMKDR